MVVKASTKPWPRRLGSSIIGALPPRGCAGRACARGVGRVCRRAFVRDASACVGRREAASAAVDRRREWLGAASVATVKGGAARLGSLVCDWWRLALYVHQVPQLLMIDVIRWRRSRAVSAASVSCSYLALLAALPVVCNSLSLLPVPSVGPVARPMGGDGSVDGDACGLAAAVRHARESIDASVADEEWQRSCDVPLRGDPPPVRGRHPTRHCWLQGVGQGRSPRTAANVTILNDVFVVCGSAGCKAIVQSNALIRAARRAARPGAAVAGDDACTARCHGRKFDAARHVRRQVARIEAALWRGAPIVERPRTHCQASSAAVGAVRAAVCLGEALDAVLEELPNARSLLATLPVSLP